MKITHLCLACSYIEGMEYQENVLPRKHKQLGYEVNIITSQYTFDSKGIQGERDTGTYINSDNIPVIVLPYASKLKKYARSYRIYKGLFQSLLTIQPDIIFCHGSQFFGMNDLVKYKKLKPSVKIFVDQHGDYINMPTDTFKRKLYHRYVWGHCARKLEKIAEIIWGVTPMRVRFLQDIYKIKPRNTGLLVMGGDESLIKFEEQAEIRSNLRKNNGIANDSFMIVTGGKIDRKKNIHLLMDAVNKMNNKDIHLVVFGSPNGDMQREIEQLALNKNVHYIGWIPSAKAYDWFLASDLAVFPGTHSVLWEQAIACGVPCIFKHWEGMDHVDVGGNCIFLYNDSADEIKNILIDIVEHKGKYESMKMVAVEKGINEFSYLEIAKRSINFPALELK